MLPKKTDRLIMDVLQVFSAEYLLVPTCIHKYSVSGAKRSTITAVSFLEHSIQWYFNEKNVALPKSYAVAVKFVNKSSEDTEDILI